jgi:hypothetical protein
VGRDDKARKVKERETSPSFASLDLFRTSEVIESRICAFLLNPRERHGQGTAFLNAFLTLVEFPTLEATSTRVSVLREAPCYSLQVKAGNRQRRLDLLLEFPNGDVLAIENKGRGAQDGEGQIDAYLEHLKNEYRGRRRLLYLSREGKAPSTKSHSSRSEALIVRDYQEIIGKWLNECSRLCASQKVREFLSDVRLFMGIEPKLESPLWDSEMDSEIHRIMRGNSVDESSLRDALLALYDARETIWKNAFSIFSRRLQELMKKHHPEWKISQGNLLRDKHWEWVRFVDPSYKSDGGESGCIVELFIQQWTGKTGDLGETVLLQLPTTLILRAYEGTDERAVAVGKDRTIRQIADIRSRDGVEYMLSTYAVEEIANEIERASLSAREEIAPRRRTSS